MGKYGFETTAEEIAAGHDLNGKNVIVTGGYSGTYLFLPLFLSHSLFSFPLLIPSSHSLFSFPLLTPSFSLPPLSPSLSPSSGEILSVSMPTNKVKLLQLYILSKEEIATVIYSFVLLLDQISC
jgi:hypothetical protein